MEIYLFAKDKNGDRITPKGMTGSKKVKDILIDRKIPAEDRDKNSFDL